MLIMQRDILFALVHSAAASVLYWHRLCAHAAVALAHMHIVCCCRLTIHKFPDVLLADLSGTRAVPDSRDQ